MKFTDKIKKGSFWVNAAKVGLFFLLAISFISLLIYSFQDVITFNWKGVAETNFNNGQWKRFFISKIIASIFYGLFIANKNTK